MKKPDILTATEPVAEAFEMTIGSIMTTSVVTVEMDDSLNTIREIFDILKFHHLLVVENRKLFGVISDRDLLKALSPFLGTPSERPRDIATLNKRAHQILSRRPIAVDRETSIEEAAHILLEKKVSCLPVISPQGDIEGIVTWKDIFRAYLHNTAIDHRNDQA